MHRWNLFFRMMLYLFLAGFTILTVTVLSWMPDLNRVKTLRQLEYGGKATILDRQGEVVGVISPTLSSGARVSRGVLDTSGFSPWLRKAVVASEDERFYQHRGVDYRGLGRAVFSTLKGDPQGGSTLTQQVVKNTLLQEMAHARNPVRKLKEALLALEVEKHFDKQEILTAYLNVVYWGVGRTDLIGAGDAARVYFGKHARDLNLAESVYLAVLLPNPRRYRDYPGYRPLMKNLLDRMVRQHLITPLEAETAWRHPLQPAGWRVKYDGAGNLKSAELVHPEALKENSPAPRVRFADSFLDEVERQLVERFGQGILYLSDVTVHTTLDRQAQQAAEKASIQARLPENTTLGMALLDPHTFEVRALVGQKLGDGLLEEWNHATRTKRQVGSSIKPLLYTLAFSQGWNQQDTVLDLPLQGKYQPQNFNGRFSGQPVTLRDALDHSLNLPAVRLLDQLGVEAFTRKLQQLGLNAETAAGLPLAIGALEASPLEMAAAYAPFVNGGKYQRPHLILKVVQGEKTLLQNPPAKPVQVWDERTAYLGLDLLQGFVNDLTPAQGGLGWKARIPGWQVGGKTGTTNDVRDLWFVGVTPELAGAVWVGRSDNAPLPAGFYSGDTAAPLWQEAMAGALRGETYMAFQTPMGMAMQQVKGKQVAVRTAKTTVQQRPAAGLRAVQTAQQPVRGRTTFQQTSQQTPENSSSSPKVTLLKTQEQERKMHQQKVDTLLEKQAAERRLFETEQRGLLAKQQQEQTALKLKMANLVRQQQVAVGLQKLRILSIMDGRKREKENQNLQELLRKHKQDRVRVYEKTVELQSRHKAQRVRMHERKVRLLQVQKQQRIRMIQQESQLLTRQKQQRIQLMQQTAQL